MFVFPWISMEKGDFHRYGLLSGIPTWMLKVARKAKHLNPGLLAATLPLYNN